MSALVAAGENIINTHQAGYRQLITGLPTAALNWVPGPEMNSITVLATHAWGSLRGWLSGAAGIDIGRDRDAEFRARAGSADELIDYIDTCADDARRYLARLANQDLSVVREIRGSQHTVAFALLHALEHCAEHLGHIGVTRQMWDQRRDA